MPHVDDTTKTRVKNDNMRVTKVNGKGEMTGYGELCYAFSQVFLNEYNKYPKWENIHAIRKMSKHPFSTEATSNIIAQNSSQFDHEDVLIAADLAFLEFYRVVVSVHEDVKMQQNGNAFEGANTPKFVRGNKQKVAGYLEA